MMGCRRLWSLPLLTTLLFGATRSSSAAVIYLNTTAGASLLRNATHPRPFLQLAQHFVTQVRDLWLPCRYCDLA